MWRMTLIFFLLTSLAGAGELARFGADTLDAEGGRMVIFFIGHGTLMIQYQKMVIHVDPVGEYADYAGMPRADLILVTHEHQDHLDLGAIKKLMKKTTRVIGNRAVQDRLPKATVLNNGDSLEIKGLEIKAVPAYNTTPGRDRFHPRGRDNGYIVNIGGRRIYIAGDTEDIPEMAELGKIDVAFLPVNQPYTMTPQQAARAARMIKPRILYPYHYGDTDISVLPGLLRDLPEIEVRIRSLK